MRGVPHEGQINAVLSPDETRAYDAGAPSVPTEKEVKLLNLP